MLKEDIGEVAIEQKISRQQENRLKQLPLPWKMLTRDFGNRLFVYEAILSTFRGSGEPLGVARGSRV